jgi:hypothetical protein
LGRVNREIMIQAGLGTHRRPYLKNKAKKVSQVVGHLQGPEFKTQYLKKEKRKNGSDRSGME